MLTNITPIRPAQQFSPEQIAAIASAAGAMVNAGLQILDAIGPDPDLEDDLEDRCAANDDVGTHDSADLGDGYPGDDADAEDGGDTEPNGDEGDYSDGDCGIMRHGIDQTRPISADNPEVA